VLLYLAANFVYLYGLGTEGLAATETPASSLMRQAFGPGGAKFIALGISISTLGFLSQGMLTAPRVYFAMAEDGLFFKRVGLVDPRTRVPVVAIALQGLLAVVIALSGRYEQILNYVVSVDFIWFGLTAASLFVFRRRAGRHAQTSFRVPGHPLTTLLFVMACALIVMSTVYKYPANSAIGLGLVAAGVPVYFLWRAWGRR
ncbi:MAG TPA: amino acid permease, partial [Pyrinomonadaceae bacterium]|nr:amino acid permease [Pyrinomonadaceae bacterium]